MASFNLDSNAITMSSSQSIGYLMQEEPQEKIKRPMNAFMVWASGRRREISSKCPTLHNSDISRMLGGEWKTMTESQKRPYREEARRLVLQHKAEHPGYKYCPKRKLKGPNPQYLNGMPLRKIVPSNSPPSMALRVNNPPTYVDRSDQISERSDESDERMEQNQDAVNRYQFGDFLRKPDSKNGEEGSSFGEEQSASYPLDLGSNNRRIKSLATGCTAIVGNPMEVFRSQQSAAMDTCSIYETGNKTVVVTFAKYNLTLRLEPEKLAANLLPIFNS